MKTILTFFVILSISIASAESYVLKSLFFDEGGKEITSSNYKCRISFGKQFASSVISSSNYRAVLGIWPFPLTRTVPATQGNEIVNVSNSNTIFSLSECYPNPTKANCQIRYSIPVESNVVFQIINTAGRIIRVLINNKQEPGCYNLSWNVKDIPQSLLPNGVYFYQIIADNFTATKKIVILR